MTRPARKKTAASKATAKASKEKGVVPAAVLAASSKAGAYNPAGNPFIIPNNNRIYTNDAKMRIARDMLERYTGSPPERFRKQIILTNFEYYLQRFQNLWCPRRKDRGYRAVVIVNFMPVDVRPEIVPPDRVLA